MTDAHEPEPQEPEAVPNAEATPARPGPAGEGPTVRLGRPAGPPPGEGTTVPLKPTRPAPEPTVTPPPGEGPTVSLKLPPKPPARPPAGSPAEDDEVTTVLGVPPEAPAEGPAAGDEVTAVLSSPPGTGPGPERPASELPASERPGSERPGSERPASERRGMERSGADRSGMEPSGSARRGSAADSVAADDEPTVEAALPVRPPRPPDTDVVQAHPAADRAMPAGDRPTSAADRPMPAVPLGPEAPASGGGRESVSGGGRESAAGTGRGSLDPVIIGGGAVPVASGDSAAVLEKGLDRGERAIPPKGERDEPDKDEPDNDSPAGKSWRRLSSAGALIWVLLALFGFTLVVQLRSNNTDEGLATARQEDLVRILSDLEARDTRLQGEITTLEQSQRQLTSGVEGRQAALAEADKRADELGLLAGTLPGRGPGLKIVIDPKGSALKASAILNAVQELRGAGGEVMEVAGPDGAAVRIVASSYFVDAEGGGIVVDGTRVPGPYTLWVIGAPQTMQTALQIPGGVVASVNSAGGSVTMEVHTMVEVTAVHRATTLQYARPVS